MRVAIDLLAERPELPLIGGTGALSCQRLLWTCAGVVLDLRVLAVAPIDLPEPEASEPVPGAIARVVRAAQGAQALLLLANPGKALGATRIALAEGVRLLSILGDDNLASWDAALAAGLPIYGVRGTAVLNLVRAQPANALSALAYGGFTACEGLEPDVLEEDRRGVRWRLPVEANASVIVRGGFVAAEIPGREGAYTDRGTEHCVRVELRSAVGTCWTQPRFIAPRPA